MNEALGLGYLDLVLPVLVFLLAAAWLLQSTATRLDRLHHKVETSRAALDAALVRRATVSVELATSGLLDPATGLLLAGAAAEALEASGEDREGAESDLSQALRLALDDPATHRVVAADHVGAGMLSQLSEAARRVQLARRFHNEAVVQAQRVRHKPVVRWARLAGHADMPTTFESDDGAPAALF